MNTIRNVYKHTKSTTVQIKKNKVVKNDEYNDNKKNQ